MASQVRCRTVADFPTGFDLTTEAVRVAELRFDITAPRSAEDLIDEAEYANDERLPYWADLWPSGRALASELAEQDIAGKRILELGAGLALPCLVALARGAVPLATDWYAPALAFAQANAHAAGVGELATMVVDWSSPPAELFARGPFDMIIGADIAYERRHAAQLSELLARLAAPGAIVVIADPRRPDAHGLIDALRAAGWPYVRTERIVDGRRDEQGPVIHLHRFRIPG